MADMDVTPAAVQPDATHMELHPDRAMSDAQVHGAGANIDVVMAEQSTSMHADDAHVEHGPGAGDAVFDMKAESAEAPVGFDDYEEEDDFDHYGTDDMMQIDLENADVDELERQKQLLLAEKKKLIEQLKASGLSDLPEFAALEAELQEAEAEAANTPNKKRGRPRKSEGLASSDDAFGDSNAKRRRGRPPKKKAKYDDNYEPDGAYYEPTPVQDHPVVYQPPKVKYSAVVAEPAAESSKRVKPQWSLAETKMLLRLMEHGYHDPESIWEQMSHQGGHRKNLEIVRSKRVQMAQKAAARGISIIELLREEIMKMEASGIPAESGVLDDEPLALDPVSMIDVPAERPGYVAQPLSGSSKVKRTARSKRGSEVGVAAAAPAPPTNAPGKITVRPAVRFTAPAAVEAAPAPEPGSAEVRSLLTDLKESQELNRQLLHHHTQMMEVMFREIKRLKDASKQLLNHAGISSDLLDEELPSFGSSSSSLSQPQQTETSAPNQLAVSVPTSTSLSEVQEIKPAHSVTEVTPSVPSTEDSPADVEMQEEMPLATQPAVAPSATSENEPVPASAPIAASSETDGPQPMGTETHVPQPMDTVDAEIKPVLQDETDDEAEEATAAETV